MSTIPETWKRPSGEDYMVLRDNLQPRKVMEHLPLSDKQKSELDNMRDDHARTDHLIMHVLPNAPESMVDDFKNGLKLTGQENLIPYTTDGGKGVKRPLSVDSGLPNSVPMDDFPCMVHVNDNKYMKLMQYRDKTIINLREYITDMDGKLHPTKKGILLSLEDWQALVQVDISALIEQKRIA